MKRTLLFGWLVLLASLPIFSQADDFAALAGSAEPAAAPASLGVLKWSGDQEFAYRLGAYDPATRTGGQVDGKLSGEYKLGDLKVVASGQAKDNEFVPGETAVFYAPGTFKFGLGLQEFSWGVADKKNPTDTLNARDYRYGADAGRLVNPAATVAWYPAPWVSVEAVYEPWKERSKFPVDFRANTQANLAAKGLPTTVTQEAEKKDGTQPVFGGRTNLFLPGVDVSLSYVYDKDIYYTPVITMGLGGSGYYPSSIELVQKRIQRLGIDAKTTVDKYGFWIETSYNITEDPSGTDDAVRNSNLEWTTGLDFNYGPASEYYANLQYFGKWVPGYDTNTLKDYTPFLPSNAIDKAYMTKMFYRSLTQSLGSETEEWLHGLTASLKFPLDDDLVTPSVSGAVMLPVGYDDTQVTRIASAYFKPEVDFKPADGVHILFGADLAYGWIKKAGSSEVTLDTTNDKLGIYTPQNSVYVKIDYQWNGSLGTN